METRYIIQKELMEISPHLGQIEKGNPYFVSPSYFDQLSDEIIGKINSGKEPVYYFLQVIPYTVPTGYFGTLSSNILRKVKQNNFSSAHEELQSISPLLNTISKKTTYTVPNGYFDGVLVKPDTIIEKKTTKVVPVNFLFKLNRYAVAAVLISILSLGIFLFYSDDSEKLPEKSNAVIADVHKLSEKDIVEFLKKSSATDALTIIPDKDTKAIKQSVKEMSDKEIKQFLKESGEYDEI